MAETPAFRTQDIPLGIIILIQSLVTQLIESQALTVEQAEKVFDAAVKKAGKETEQPDAARLIQHVHDTLQWDEYYKWQIERRKGGG